MILSVRNEATLSECSCLDEDPCNAERDILDRGSFVRIT